LSFSAKPGQVADVVQGVLDLPLAQRPAAPVGAGLLFAGRFAQELVDQRAEAGRILDADQAGGQLHVEQSGRRLAHRAEAEFHLAAAGVNDRLVARRGDRFPEGPQVGQLDGVDQGHLPFGNHLDQAEMGPVRVLGDELRIETDPRAAGQPGAEFLQLLARRDVQVRHWPTLPVL
jgi:hypothetical protein